MRFSSHCGDFTYESTYNLIIFYDDYFGSFLPSDQEKTKVET